MVILLAIIGAIFMFGNSENIISYDDNLNVTLPASFETSEENGFVNEAYPEDKSYVLKILEEENITASEIDGQWAYIKDNQEILKSFNYTNIKDYTIGNNKIYEAVISNSTTIKDEMGFDGQKVRCVDVVVPNSQKVYGLYFLTNDTSVDLYNADIESIINSTAAA